MEDISLHILDIAENSVNAGAKKVEVSIKEDKAADRFTLRIEDDGKGITAKKIADPYFTGKTGKKFGLGIPLLAQAARECDGRISIDSRKPRGTSITADFRMSHADMKPLGDVGSTIAVLACGHPETDFMVRYERDGSEFSLDTGQLREKLGGVPLFAPMVFKYIKDEINEGIRRTRDEG